MACICMVPATVSERDIPLLEYTGNSYLAFTPDLAEHINITLAFQTLQVNNVTMKY